MDVIFSMAGNIWTALAPTTWILLLGLLIWFNLLRKTLF